MTQMPSGQGLKGGMCGHVGNKGVFRKRSEGRGEGDTVCIEKRRSVLHMTSSGTQNFLSCLKDAEQTQR